MNIFQKCLRDYKELDKLAWSRKNNGIMTLIGDRRYVEDNVDFSVNNNSDFIELLFYSPRLFDFQDLWDRIKTNGKETYDKRIKRRIDLPSEINGIKEPKSGYLFDLHEGECGDLIIIEKKILGMAWDPVSRIERCKNHNSYPPGTVKIEFDSKKDFRYFMNLFSELYVE